MKPIVGGMNLLTVPLDVGSTCAASSLPLDPATVARIQAFRSYPAVSILMSSGSDRARDRLQLAGLIEKAESRLLAEFTRPTVEPLLDALTRAAATAEVGNRHQALALFATKDFAATVALPVTVRNRAVVDETFATRDLVHALLRSPHYRVLVLGDTARLYIGVGACLTEVTTDRFPLFDDPDVRPHPSRFGVDRSERRDASLRRYLRAVDVALAGHLDAHLPLLAVGTGRRLSLFAQSSRYRANLTGTLSGAFERRSTVELEQAIWPSVTDMFDQRHREAFAELDRAAGARRSAIGVGQAWVHANLGRGAHVVVEENFCYSARINLQSHDLTAAADITHPEVVDDIVDEIIEIVLAKGGRATIVPDGSLASRGRLALALRY